MSAKDFKKRRVVDYDYFEFDRDMNTDKGSAKIEILKVVSDDDDIDEGHTLPPGNEVQMLQIIIEEKLVDVASDGKLDVKQRGTPSKLGKDPDGKKAGVNLHFVSRLSGYYVHYGIEMTEKDVIDCLNYYPGREETLLQLVSLLLENGGNKDTLLRINDYMERYKGNYRQMFDDLQNDILSFGGIDLVPMESPTGSSIVLYGDEFDADNDDDGYDGMSVSGVEKVKRPREDF